MPGDHFQTITHAKCILTGEHAVLRGADALVCPVIEKILSLSYQKTAPDSSVSADDQSTYGENVLLLFWPMLERALNRVGHSLSDINGHFLLANHIPIASGLGFSASICVAITRWLIWMGFLEEEKLFGFARSLEDLFHGKSSGVDIVGVISDQPMCYRINECPKALDIHWQPKLYLSCSPATSVTVQGISHTEKLWRTHPKKAQHVHYQMQHSSHLAQLAMSGDPKQGQEQLLVAIQKAHDCFKAWGLIEHDLLNHITELKKLGAIAAKPTGSGGNGGYVLSLWKEQPHVPFEMTPLRLLSPNLG